MNDRRTPPFEQGSFFLGSARAFAADMLGFFGGLQKEHGDIVRFRLARSQSYLVCHPAMAQEVLGNNPDIFVKFSAVKRQRGISFVVGNGLVTSSGDLWHRQRKLITPMLRPSMIEGFADTMLQAAGDLVTRLENRCKRPEGIDVNVELTHLALHIALVTMFGKTAKDFAALEQVIPEVLRFAYESISRPVMVPLWVPTPRNRRFCAAMGIIDRYVNGLIRDRMLSGEERADLLGLLLDAKVSDEDGHMTLRQVRDEAVTMLGAGHETSATAMTWMLLELARRPDIADRARAEILDVVGSGELAFHHLRHLRYLHAFVQEALRLYPPVPFIPRAVQKHTKIGDYEIEKGSLVFISTYHIQRHPDVWENPSDLNPDRFLVPQGSQMNRRCAYMPFGAGERFCVGSNFALVELQIVLASILRRFKLRANANQQIGAHVAVTMKPSPAAFLHFLPVEQPPTGIFAD